ncbi:hypothetical protein ANN_16255 [Periplaneta americana]|uniref:Uncharacterized protein n=1 Tax=Periplaneta americana TaxID=6978 RepID=A0ABQ8SJF7_PERAM|nr:hypothetical protein ANN_16255 [Periplaneta americana]
MSPGSSTESYPAFPHTGLRENPGKNLNQVTCPNRESNPGHLVSRPDSLTNAVPCQIISVEQIASASRNYGEAEICGALPGSLNDVVHNLRGRFTESDSWHFGSTTIRSLLYLESECGTPKEKNLMRRADLWPLSYAKNIYLHKYASPKIFFPPASQLTLYMHFWIRPHVLHALPISNAVQFKVCHGSLYAVMWLVDDPSEFNLPTLPQSRITYVPEKMPSKYGVHSEEYLPIRKLDEFTKDVINWSNREPETLAHVLGSCPHGEVLRNSRHHRIRSMIAEQFRSINFQVFEEVHGLADNGSTRRIEMIAIPPNNNNGYIIDPTVRFKKQKSQPEDNVISIVAFFNFNEKQKALQHPITSYHRGSRVCGYSASSLSFHPEVPNTVSQLSSTVSGGDVMQELFPIWLQEHAKEGGVFHPGNCPDIKINVLPFPRDGAALSPRPMRDHWLLGSPSLRQEAAAPVKRCGHIPQLTEL